MVTVGSPSSELLRPPAIEREQTEIDGHDLDDRAHAAQRGADTGPDERRFRQRRVADALRSEFF
jgi:hypothetical protein